MELATKLVSGWENWGAANLANQQTQPQSGAAFAAAPQNLRQLLSDQEAIHKDYSREVFLTGSKGWDVGRGTNEMKLGKPEFVLILIWNSKLIYPGLWKSWKRSNHLLRPGGLAAVYWERDKVSNWNIASICFMLKL